MLNNLKQVLKAQIKSQTQKNFAFWFYIQNNSFKFHDYTADYSFFSFIHKVYFVREVWTGFLFRNWQFCLQLYTSDEIKVNVIKTINCNFIPNSCNKAYHNLHKINKLEPRKTSQKEQSKTFQIHISFKHQNMQKKEFIDEESIYIKRGCKTMNWGSMMC